MDVATKIDTAMKDSSHRAFLLSIMKSLYLLMRQEGMAGHLWGIADEVLAEVVHRKYSEEGKVGASGDANSPEVGKRFKDTLASAARVEELNDENKRLRAQLALRVGPGGGSKIMLRPEDASTYFILLHFIVLLVLKY